MSHDWIFDVLADLKRYALKNGFPKLASQVEVALEVARAEVVHVNRGPPEDDDGRNGNGGMPPRGRRN